jgi:hypothetical protein
MPTQKGVKKPEKIEEDGLTVRARHVLMNLNYYYPEEFSKWDGISDACELVSQVSKLSRSGFAGKSIGCGKATVKNIEHWLNRFGCSFTPFRSSRV